MIFDLLEKLLFDFASAIPKFVGAILVIFIGWMIAKAVAKIVKKVLKTIGIDKLAEQLNEIEIVDKANIKIVPSILLSKILYYILLLIFMIAGTELLGMPAVSELMGDIINYVPYLISAMIVFIIGLLVAEFIKNIILTATKSLNIPAGKFIATFVFYFLLITVTMSALSQARIETDFITSNLSIILAGGVAAFAIGYGFASRDLMANFIASFYSKSKIRMGDMIAIDGAEGVVVALDATSFTLQADGKKIIIPLSKLTSEKVEIFQDK